MMFVVMAAIVVFSDELRARVEAIGAAGAEVVADHPVAVACAVCCTALVCLLLAGMVSGGPSGRHVYAPHPDTHGFDASKLTTAAAVGKAAREVARRVRRRQRAGGPRPRWGLFRYGNVLAWAIFVWSSYSLLATWRAVSVTRGAADGLETMQFVRSILSRSAGSGPLLAVAGLSLSLGYLLVFSSVSFLYRDVLKFVGGEPDATDASSESSADGEEVSGPADGHDVVIVGCGVAGASLAVQLGRQGKRVLVVERNMEEVERIVGELLQPGGLQTLERIGLDSCAKEGIESVEVHGYNVIRCVDGKHLPLQYPLEVPRSRWQLFGCCLRSAAWRGSDKARPMGRSFHNSRFVQNLRKAALAAPNVTIQVGVATGFVKEDAGAVAKGGDDRDVVKGVTVRDLETREVREVRAPMTVVCDGIGSGLRRHVTAAKKTVVSHFVGLILHHPVMETPLPMPHYGHVLLADPNPVLLYQISHTETRVLIDVPLSKKPSGAAFAEYVRTTIAPQFPEELRPALLEAIDTQQPRAMSNGSLNAEQPRLRGAVLLGDAWNIRHPLTGAGMTVALRDSEMLAATLDGARLDDADEMEARLAIFRRGRSSHASTINILANALHRVFSAPEDDASGKRKRLREACYRYLAKGGFRTAGPVGLLAGITPHPWVLTTHFFMVAAYAARDAFLPFPTPRKLLQAYDLIHVACLIIMPMLAAERVTLLGTSPLLWASNLFFPWKSKDIAAELN